MGRRHPPPDTKFTELLRGLPEEVRRGMEPLARELETLGRWAKDSFHSDPLPHHTLHRPDRSEDPVDTAVPSSDVDGAAPAAGSAGTLLRSDAKLRLGITTTKGDLIARNGTQNTRLGVGADGEVLTADSTQAIGVKWAPGGGGDLDALTDVTLTTPAVGDRLRFDGSQWVNSTLTWQPLTTVVAGVPDFVWDADNRLVLTEEAL